VAWISLTEAKDFLRKNQQTSVDDVKLTLLMEGACDAIEDIKGHVDPVSFTVARRAEPVTQRHHYWHHDWMQRSWLLSLPETPVASITAVDSLDGAGGTTSVPAADLVAGTIGWELVDTVLHVPGPGPYRVQYVAGRVPVPENYIEAALELTLHLWRGSQLNQGGGRGPGETDQSMVVPGFSSAMPYRVRELLGIYGDVVNDHVVIG
jgi:hypothetical protein